MNARADGEYRSPTKAEILASLQEWVDDEEIEEFDEQGERTWYWDGEEIERIVYYLETDSVERIRGSIVADEEVKKLIDTDRLADFVWNYIDTNALMVLDGLMLVWDDDKGKSKARDEMEDRTGDEYAQFVGEDVLGMCWVDKQIVVINIRELMASSEEIALDHYETRSLEEIFQEGLVQTIIHECRHLFYECNEFVQLDDELYPKNGGDEWRVEEYGNLETERLMRDEKARTYIAAMFDIGEKTRGDCEKAER